MGFFKNIGKSLKGVTKAISLKNGLKIVSGDYRGVVEEVQGRIVKGVKTAVQGEVDKKFNNVTPKTKNPQIAIKTNPHVGDVAQSLGEQYITPWIDKQKDSLANDKNAQNVSTILTKQYLLTMWSKYKTYIIIGAVAVVGLIFRKKIFGTKTRRR